MQAKAKISMHREEMATKKAEFYQAWQNSLKSFKAALHTAKTSYYSSLINENTNNPRLLFSAVTKLTQNHNSIKQSIPPHLEFQ